MTVTHDPSPGPTLLERTADAPNTPHRRARRRLRRAARAARAARTARAAHTGPRPTLRWRILVATAGALLLTVCSGMALGVVTWTPSGLSIGFGDAPQGPPRVDGTDGVFPAGPARNISLTVQNSAAAAFEITAVQADLGGLDDECPGSAWDVGVPELLPTVPARSEVALPLPVTLRADAPDSCQGATARFPVHLQGLRHPEPASSAGSSDSSDSSGSAGSAGSVTAAGSVAGAASAPVRAGGLREERLDTWATVTAARLGSPGGTASVKGSQVEVVPTTPPNGPTPAGYDVEVLGAADRLTAVCHTPTAAACLDETAPPAAERRYLVTAEVGTHWRRGSPQLTVWTPPPSPRIAFADGRPTGSAVRLWASAAESAYDVDLVADGGSPFHSVHVAAGGSLDQTVSAPDLGSGSHRLVAVARYHGWRAPSGGLHLTISTNGVATPGPEEDPAPVSSEPGPTTVPTTVPTNAPPVVDPTGTSAAVPTRTTSLPSISSKIKPTVAHPPIVVIDPPSTTDPVTPSPTPTDAPSEEPPP